MVSDRVEIVSFVDVTVKILIAVFDGNRLPSMADVLAVMYERMQI